MLQLKYMKRRLSTKKTLIISALVALVVAGLLVALYHLLPVSLMREDPSDPIERIEASDVEVRVVAENLEMPWAIDFGENGDIFFTERNGYVRLIRDDRLIEDPLLELPQVDGEGGTLGLALGPDFTETGYVFIYYTDENYTNRLSRYRLQNDRLVDETVIIDNIPGAFTHNGGRIAFGPDDLLYIGTGDAEEPDLSQDESSLAGKILRVAVDGSIPDANPYPDSPVYSIGHRNVQGLAWDSEGRLFATEHGPRARDEVNRIEPGANYGWPVVAGEVDTDEGASDPVPNYRNPFISSGSNTWAPSGATIYDREEMPVEWRETLLFSGLRSQALWRYSFEDGSLSALFSDEYGRIRNVTTSPDGTIYLLTSNRDGRGSPADNDDRILQIIPIAD